MDTFISLFDHISYKPFLYVNDSSRYKTLIPSILGCVIFSLIFAISVFFLNIVISRKTPSILFNDLENYYPTLNFSNETLLVYLSRDINGDASLYDSSLYNLKTTNMNYRRKVDENGNSIPNNNHTQVDLIKCDQKSISNYDITNSSNTLCISPGNNVTLSGIYANEKYGYSYLNIYVIKCENITTYELIDGINTTVIKNKYDLNGEVCKSNSVIESSIKSLYLNFGMKIGIFDHNNFTNPIIKKSTRFTMHLSNTLFKRHFIKLRNIIYETDVGMVFEEKNIFKDFVLSEIIVDGTIGDGLDIMLPKSKMYYNSGWVLDLSTNQKKVKRNLDRFPGHGFVDIKQAYYGIYTSGLIQFFLPYDTKFSAHHRLNNYSIYF